MQLPPITSSLIGSSRLLKTTVGYLADCHRANLMYPFHPLSALDNCRPTTDRKLPIGVDVNKRWPAIDCKLNSSLQTSLPGLVLARRWTSRVVPDYSRLCFALVLCRLGVIVVIQTRPSLKRRHLHICTLAFWPSDATCAGVQCFAVSQIDEILLWRHVTGRLRAQVGKLAVELGRADVDASR